MEQLKGIIANMEMDVAIVRGDVASVMAALQSEGFSVTPEEVKQCVTELRADPYYTFIAKDIK